MLLMLFYTQEIKDFITGAVKITDLLNNNSERKSDFNFKKALDNLACDKVITEDEKNELENLINYRNDIAHRLYQLVADLNSKHYSTLEIFRNKYNYKALHRLKSLQKTIFDNMMTKYVLPIGLKSLTFSYAESVYEKELVQLKKKIKKQLSLYEEAIAGNQLK